MRPNILKHELAPRRNWGSVKLHPRSSARCQLVEPPWRRSSGQRSQLIDLIRVHTSPSCVYTISNMNLEVPYAISTTTFVAAARRFLGRRTELSKPNQPESDKSKPNNALRHRYRNDCSGLFEWLRWELHAN